MGMTWIGRGAAAAAVGLLLTLSQAAAQEWPQRTVKIMIGFGAGGGTDIVTRILAQRLQEKLGQPFIVENKPGAGGVTAANDVARAEPDGYTLLMMANAHIIAGVMNKTLPYDTIKSFAPVGQVATAGLIIVTRPDFPANNVKELIAAAKAEPGKLTFASVGAGSTQHFTGALFMQSAGIDMLHVPFRRSPEAIAGVMGKQVDVLFDTVSAVLGQVQSKDLKPIAVTGKERFPAVPDVPFASEGGAVPDYEVTTWYGMLAPLGTPAPIVAKLNKTLNEIIVEPDVRDRMIKAGVIPKGSTPEAFAKHMESEFGRWGAVREKAGIEQR